jgi:hypothetical protein
MYYEICDIDVAIAMASHMYMLSWENFLRSCIGQGKQAHSFGLHEPSAVVERSG